MNPSNGTSSIDTSTCLACMSLLAKYPHSRCRACSRIFFGTSHLAWRLRQSSSKYHFFVVTLHDGVPADVEKNLRPNKSSSYKSPQSQVTFTTISPVYEYSGHRLWLAYGLAIAISVLIVIAGLVVMYLSSAAYNSSFSTILRLGRGAHLSQEIVHGDHDGKEPLPEYLEKATISFAGTALRKQGSNGDAEYELVPVQAPGLLTTQESPGGRADSHRPSTLQSSIGECEGRESNVMSPDEPVRWPQGNGSDARSHSSNIEEGEIGSLPRPEPDRVLQVPQSRSRI
jgi:hypothetical protein